MTLEHMDSLNLPNGWCAIYCTGHFDPRIGGHLILRDLGLVVEFPPGSVILIPSATLTHGNVPVRTGETRRSFTQYAAGGLFRWVHYDFRTVKVVKEQDPERAAFEENPAVIARRWQQAMDMYSTLESLHQDRMDLNEQLEHAV